MKSKAWLKFDNKLGSHIKCLQIHELEKSIQLSKKAAKIMITLQIVSGETHLIPSTLDRENDPII